MSAPSTTIKICSGVRLNSRYEHSIYFPDPAAQSAYFEGKVVRQYSKVSYCRKTWPLQVEATMAQASKWSYLFFRNGEDGKTYYYFINNIEYKNDASVILSLELDVLQTYMFDFHLMTCFVERQHTETDAIGEHVVDEGLDVGELVDCGHDKVTSINDLCILVLASINPNEASTETPVHALSGMYNRVFSGLKVWAVNSTQWAAWGEQLDALSEAGFLDGIIAMWMYPKSMVVLGGENTWSDTDLCKTVSGASGVDWVAVDLNNDPNTCDGYTPKNKKLLTYPYRMAYMTNHAGSSAVLRYERSQMSGSRAPLTLAIRGAVAPDSGVFIYPIHYNGSSDAYEHGLMVSNFPSCAWDADVYKMWLAQNQNQHDLAKKSAIITAGAGALTAIGSLAAGNVQGAVGGAGALVTGVHQIFSMMAQDKDMEIQPPQARGQFSTSINVALSNQTVTVYHKSITAKQAKRLDGFFNLYGYKIAEMRTPNLAARPAYTYIKTVGCHIHSLLCTEDAVKIESIFDNGITWWRNGDRVCDYTQDNTPNGGE